MAKRKSQNNGENTILTIAFILSVLTSLGLLIAVGMMFQSLETKEQAKVVADNAKNNAEKITVSAEYVNLIARHVIDSSVSEAEIDAYAETHGPNIQPNQKQRGEAILQKYANFQKSYPGLAADAASLNYEKVPELLTARNKTLLGEKKQLETQIASLTSQLNVVTTAQHDNTTKQLTNSSTAVASAQKDLADFRTDRQTTAAAYDTAIKKHSDALSAKDQQIANKDTEIQSTAQRLSNQEEKNLVAQLKARPKSERFEIPDGKITSVNEASGIVWINIGSRDRLKPLTNFSVYPATQLGVMRGPGDIKAKIEVIKILDGQFAQCRITEDSINDPILIGDQIYSPLWQRGIQVHFALIGFFDIDGDGKSDRDKVKNIIRSAGGIIDAELSIENTTDSEKTNLIRTGNVTVDTQYLVRGSVDAIINIDRTTYNRFEEKAKDYNVESITVNSLLNYAGYKNTRDAMGLSRGFDNGDPKTLVKPVLKEADQRNQLRKPPTRGTDGAF
ncbi:MAG: hypothetical protein HOB73_15890 [Planctomycetaceae bacterium]|jgi:hypothetical protein|nr:hypothetical protein [Planctomycetaceae bacterium]